MAIVNGKSLSVCIPFRYLPFIQSFAKANNCSVSKAVFLMVLIAKKQIESGNCLDSENIDYLAVTDDEYEESCINLAKNPIFPR